MIFEWTSLNNVTSDIVDKFDCGEENFNDFLKEQAKTWMSEGYAVTYVAVDKNELEAGNVQRIYGYAAVNSTGLLYKNADKNKYLSCAEIRMFAVARSLRGKEAVDLDGVRYSYKLFQALMQELYFISTTYIGFCAVTLNANDTGLGLYKKFGFIQSDQYIPPVEEEKIDIENCTPLIFSFLDLNALVTLFS